MQKEEILEYLGDSAKYYLEIEKEITSQYPFVTVKITGNKVEKANFRFYLGKKYVAYCIAYNGLFDCLFRFVEQEIDYINGIIGDMSTHAQKTWSVRYPCGSGAWLHYPVKNQETKEEALVWFNIRLNTIMASNKK